MTTVYHGYTAETLARLLDVEKTVDNLPEIQQQNADDTLAVRGVVPCTVDVPYGPHPAQILDIYAPDPVPAGGAPVLIDIHGGGWRGGTKNGRGFPAATLAARGVLWAPIDYALAPMVTMEEIVDQVRQSIAWLYAHVADYGGDPSRIYVSGNSAGGHLTGMLLMDGWHAAYGVPADTIKGATALSGVFDLEALVHASYGFNEQLGLTLEEARRFSPHHHPPATCPPLVVGVGALETDEFKRQSRDFAETWRAAGLPVTFVESEGDHHFSITRTFATPDTALHATAMAAMGL